MPRIPPGERPHMRSFTIEVDRAPAHIPHRIGFSEPSRYVREKLVFDIAEVIVPGMRGRSQFGYRIPSGIVLVEMD